MFLKLSVVFSQPAVGPLGASVINSQGHRNGFHYSSTVRKKSIMTWQYFIAAPCFLKFQPKASPAATACWMKSTERDQRAGVKTHPPSFAAWESLNSPSLWCHPLLSPALTPPCSHSKPLSLLFSGKPEPCLYSKEQELRATTGCFRLLFPQIVIVLSWARMQCVCGPLFVQAGVVHSNVFCFFVFF